MTDQFPEHHGYLHWTPMRHDWDPDDPDQIDTAVWVMEQDHKEQNVPAHVALLKRGAEKVWIRGYPNTRLIVFTYPAYVENGVPMVGCVREMPVAAADLASPEAFEARFNKHVTDMIGDGFRSMT